MEERHVSRMGKQENVEETSSGNEVGSEGVLNRVRDIFGHVVNAVKIAAVVAFITIPLLVFQLQKYFGITNNPRTTTLYQVLLIVCVAAFLISLKTISSESELVGMVSMFAMFASLVIVALMSIWGVLYINLLAGIIFPEYAVVGLAIDIIIVSGILAAILPDKSEKKTNTQNPASDGSNTTKWYLFYKFWK